jgi:hypothetical protein
MDDHGASGMLNKVVYIGATIFSAILTNAFMDRLLLMRARMLTPTVEEKEKPVIRLLERVINGQIVVCSILTVLGCVMLVYAVSLRGDYGVELITMVLTYKIGALVLAILHVTASVKLVLLLRRVAKSEQHTKPLALIVFTSIALSSTVVVYLDWLTGYVNVYFIMPVDSIINDLCLTALSYSAKDADLSDAKKVEVAETALTERVGRGASETDA